MPRLLSLFDGTGSICKPFREAGWEVQSLDVDCGYNCTIVGDILQWDYSKPHTLYFREYPVSNIRKQKMWRCLDLTLG